MNSVFWQAGSGSYLIRPRTRFEITKLMLGLADLEIFSYVTYVTERSFFYHLLPNTCMVEFQPGKGF